MLVKVLCIAEYYLPGYLGGGPIRTLANMRFLLHTDIMISIFTKDRDLGQDAPYPGIAQERWLYPTEGPIYYAEPAMFHAGRVSKFCAEGDFDVLYLNSFFSFRASISVVLLWRISRRPLPPILLAPRGEFSLGALGIKSFKKRVYIGVARFLGIYKDIRWHASTVCEKEDILRVFPEAKGRIYLAADPVSEFREHDISARFSPKTPGLLRISFISRISPMKNLDGLLSILRGMDRNISLSIYGPIEDGAYWQKCLEEVAELPRNVRVEYKGPLAPDEVGSAFADSDLFAFPTHGENFGHVIFESLRAGTPVLISDRTPWHDSPCGAITVLPLDAVKKWRQNLEIAVDRTEKQQAAMRLKSVERAKENMKMAETREDNLNMFRAVASGEDKF